MSLQLFLLAKRSSSAFMVAVHVDFIVMCAVLVVEPRNFDFFTGFIDFSLEIVISFLNNFTLKHICQNGYCKTARFSCNFSKFDRFFKLRTRLLEKKLSFSVPSV